MQWSREMLTMTSVYGLQDVLEHHHFYISTSTRRKLGPPKKEEEFRHHYVNWKSKIQNAAWQKILFI